MRRKHLAIAVPLVLSMGACGGSEAPQKGEDPATVTTVVIVKKPAPAPPSARHRATSRPAASTTPRSTGFVACDPNISVKATTTTCPFAENAFYEYWSGGESSSISAYSPAAGTSFAMSCSTGDPIVCTDNSGAVVRFPQAALNAYNQPQADQYAASHDLGDSSPPAPSGSSGVTSTDSASFCTTHTCIPNFSNGAGSVVQCVDGEWSHSGGLQGACSDHGGER